MHASELSIDWARMDVVWLANGVSSFVIKSRRAKGAWFGLISEQRDGTVTDAF